MGPKIEDKPEVPGMRYHVKNHPIHGWVYEEVALTNVRSTTTLLARVLIAKVEDEKRLVEIFRNTPVVQDNPNWRCRTWVAHALSRIMKDGNAVGTAQLDWGKIEALAREYVAEKTAAGRYLEVTTITQPKPTWDMLERKEVVA